MSVQAISWVLEQSVSEGGSRLVMLSIANHASHDGDSAWPSISTIARETRLSERAVQYAIPQLEESGELQVTRGGGRGNTHNFTLPKYIQWVKDLHRFNRERVQSTTHQDAERVQIETEKGARIAPEPSLEPSLNQNQPSIGRLPFQKPEKTKSKTQLRREASRVRGCSPREEFERPPAYVAPIVREWQGFELFMAAYPKDTNIEHARKVWNETKPPFDEAMNGLERWKSSDRWKSQDGKFIPDAWRFLENRNWKENPKARIERDMSFGMERLDRLALD